MALMINEVMNLPARQIFGKVEIIYSDPFLDKTKVSATTNEVNRAISPDALIDGVQGSTYKYFSLQENKLDGSYHPMPDPAIDDELAGAWGSTMSDTSGVLSVPFVATVNFSTRGLYHIDVVGDDKLNEYPVDFNVIVYDELNAIIYSYSVADNPSFKHVHDINDGDGVGNASYLVVTVTKINKASRTAKITEIYSGIQETYIGSDIVSIHLLEEQQYDANSLPIGNISSNEIDISLKNVNGKFDAGNTASPLTGLLLKNRPVRAWFGADLQDGNDITWYPLGTFWTLDWTAPRKSLAVSLTARDRLELMKETTFEKSSVYLNANLYDMAHMVLVDYGITENYFVIDVALKNVVIPYFWLDKMSHRDALKQIATAALGRVYCDRLGRVNVTMFNVPDTVSYAVTNNNAYDIDYPFAWSQIKNQVNATYTTRVVDAESEVYNSSDETWVVPANDTYVKTITFNSVPVVSPFISGYTGSGVSYTAVLYCWGGYVTFTNNTASPITVNNLTARGNELSEGTTIVVTAKDDQSIVDNGQQLYEIESDYFQSKAIATTIANSLLAVYKSPRHDLMADARGSIALHLGDKVTAPNYTNTGTQPYVVVRQELSFDGAFSAKIQGQWVGGG